jgi:5-methylcytosine-specific restriction endonuclease McrA
MLKDIRKPKLTLYVVTYGRLFAHVSRAISNRHKNIEGQVEAVKQFHKSLADIRGYKVKSRAVYARNKGELEELYQPTHNVCRTCKRELPIGEFQEEGRFTTRTHDNCRRHRVRCSDSDKIRQQWYCHTVRIKRLYPNAENTLTHEGWKAILNASRGRCPYCKKLVGKLKLTLDHKKALAKGGGHTARNTHAVCFRCNNQKNTKSDSEFKAWLRRHKPIG